MIPATEFYLLRHGESEANLAGVAAGGGVDSPLTVKGELQARSLADLIDQLAIKPSIIFSSPMKRARKTAEIINTKLGLDLRIAEGMEEHHVGEWEGKPWRDIGPRMKAGEIPPGGENYDQYAARVLKNITPILNRSYDAPPMIVAHGGTFRSLGHLYGWKISDTQNCHLHRFIPYPENSAFPWQVFEYNVYGDDLSEARSAYCPLFKA